MKTLYFDIDGTMLLMDTDRAKQALGRGMFEATVRHAGFEKLVCVGNFGHVAHLLKAMDCNYDEMNVLFRLCDGAFTDEDWFRSVTAMISDPDNRGRYIDLTEDWWYVDDLADQFLVQAGLQDVLQSQRGWRRGEFAFGQYSDDSQLARELLRSYADRHAFDPSDYARRIAAIFRENRIVGCGWATLEAAKRLQNGCPWDAAGTDRSAGNGSAMRAAPIGLLFHDDDAGLLEAAHDQGRITHRDRRCSAGAIAIAGAVVLAMRQAAIDAADSCSQLSRWTRTFNPILAEALEQMTRWVDSPPEQAVTIISRIGRPAEHADSWQGISPFVTTSVLWSLYSFLRSPNDYWEAVCTAVAVGGDVDTTAAMTGAIAGARVGLGGLPSSLARLVNDRGSWGYDELIALAHQCYSIKTAG